MLAALALVFLHGVDESYLRTYATPGVGLVENISWDQLRDELWDATATARHCAPSGVRSTLGLTGF